MATLSFKCTLYQHCIDLLKQEISDIQTAISGQQEGSEGSSSAGDKHNTEQAMQHLELEKKHQQLSIKLQSLKVLQQIDPNHICESIKLGAFVKTNRGNFYFAGPIGKIVLKGTEVMVLSVGSPLGRILSKMKKKESVCFNKELWEVEEIE